MRNGKLVICMVLLIGAIGSWLNSFHAAAASNARYTACIQAAERSFGDGLYAQAVEEYKSALAIKPSPDVWAKTKEVYDEYYLLAPDSEIRRAYIRDMQSAASAFPGERAFWTMLISLQMEDRRDADAYRSATQALRALKGDEEIRDIADQLRYKTELHYKTWEGVKAPRSGYVTAFDGSVYHVLNDAGQTIQSGYAFIGPVSKEGFGVYQTPLGFRLFDAKGVDRAAFPDGIVSAGIFSSEDKLVPLQIGETWRYYGIYGETLPGAYEKAGAFVRGTAAVLDNKQWKIIDTEGDVKEELPFEDLRLGASGEYMQAGLIVAKSGGKWGLFNSKYERIGDFAADEADRYNQGEALAFRNGSKWGFVDAKGIMIIEQRYDEAKSFSYGLAAVRNHSLGWGFINSEGKLVIPYQFRDVGYFHSSQSCYVQTEEGFWQQLSFVLG